MKRQKIAILGTGAMGSVYAALMPEAGNEIWAVDTWAEHVKSINANGLRAEGASGDRVVKGIHAVANVAQSDPCDLYVIATKCAGFNARAFEDIHQLIWEKILCNVTLSAPCTVFDCTAGELMAKPEWREIAMGCMHETHACGLAEGIRFSFEDPVQYVTDFAAMMRLASPSMRLDHMAHHASEIDAINGMAPVVAARHILTTPFNQTPSAVIRAREAAFEKAKT